MCMGKPKVKDIAPAATVMNSDVEAGAVDSNVAEKARKKKGFASTRTDPNNTILGAMSQGGTGKSTLG